MWKTATAFAALTAVFLASSANASDLLGNSAKDAPGEVVSYKAPKSWSGIWAGAVGGMAFYNTAFDWDIDGGEGEGAFDHNFIDIDGLGSEGLFGEAQLGFDKQVGKFVVGVFGGVNYSDAEFNANLFDKINISTDYEWGGVVGARVGVLKSPDTLFYAAGGWAFAKLGDVEVTQGDETEKFATEDLSGWFGELGMETRLTDNIYLTLAGRYTDYGSETLTIDAENSIEVDELDTDALAVMVGLKAKLGIGN